MCKKVYYYQSPLVQVFSITQKYSKKNPQDGLITWGFGFENRQLETILFSQDVGAKDKKDELTMA